MNRARAYGRSRRRTRNARVAATGLLDQIVEQSACLLGRRGGREAPREAAGEAGPRVAGDDGKAEPVRELHDPLHLRRVVGETDRVGEELFP